MSVKCKEPIDELTVQVWLLYHQPNFKYCTLFVSGTELRTDRQTNGRTNKRTDKQTDRWMIQTLPYRSRGPLIFPRIGVGNEGVCPRRRPRRYGTVYLYRALTWSSVVLWSCRHDASPVSRPTWTYVVLLSCRHSRKAISRTALRKYRQVTSLPVQVLKAMNRKIGQLAVKVLLSNL